jgi:hypothetical protein
LVGRAGSDRHRWETRRTGARDQKTDGGRDAVDGLEMADVEGKN